MKVVIGSYDLTHYTLLGNYNVNKVEEYADWTDGRGYTHRDLIRTRVGGSFEVFFKDMNDYESFIDTLKLSKKQNNSYRCEVMCNNVNEVVTCDCFISFTPSRTQDGTAQDRVSAFSIKLEER